MADVRPPSRHDHVGHMVYGDVEAYCDPDRGGCGQGWYLAVDRTGKPIGWRPITERGAA